MNEQEMRSIIREELAHSNLATKDDLKQFVTRNDIRESIVDTVEEVLPLIIKEAVQKLNVARKSDIEAVNSRLDTFEGRFLNIRQRFDVIDQYLTNLHNYLQTLNQYHQTIDSRLDNLERRVSVIESATQRT